MNIAIFGAGMMAKAAAYDICRDKSVKRIRIITKTDQEGKDLKRLLKSSKVEAYACDVTDINCVAGSLKGIDAALSCVPYNFNLTLAKAAIQSGVHFVDLGGNDKVVKDQLKHHAQAKKKGVLIVPDCGLAPGLVSVFTKAIVEEFDVCDAVHLRVGGLPLHPQPPLNYALVFSVHGLINEYIEPVTILSSGKKKIIEPLSEIELLTFPRPFDIVEAFTTSGGTSTLTKTYQGKIKSLDYKTIRYIGHCSQIQAIRFLELTSSERMNVGRCSVSPRDLLEYKLMKTLPRGKEDAVLLRCWGVGKKDGKKKTITYQIVDTYDKKSGLTAMQRMTAFPAVILLRMIGSGKVTQRGVLTQEHFVDTKEIFKELKKRGIRIAKTIK